MKNKHSDYNSQRRLEKSAHERSWNALIPQYCLYIARGLHVVVPFCNRSEAIPLQTRSEWNLFQIFGSQFKKGKMSNEKGSNPDKAGIRCGRDT